MDNASKALIIAGGVLIGIMVISVALYILATARGMARDSNEEMERTAAESFNRFYQSYDSQITGIDALNIYNKVQDDHWRYETKRTLDHDIFINQSDAFVEQFNGVDGMINMKKTFQYQYADNDNDGYIDNITIYE